MTTATEALFTPVQYFTALDPYNWRVDNRPLSDLSDNDVTLSEGIETAFHSGKLNSAALGSTLRALAGNGRMMGAFTVSGSALTANILYSVFTLTANVSGKTVSLVGLQPDLVSFALTAPAAGYKKLHTIAAKYQSPDLDLPYFDSSLALDGSQIATGNLEYEVKSSTVALAAAETYPVPGSGFTEVIRIKVLATDTVISPNNITYPNFVLEGQAFNYASQTRQGQVIFANSADIAAGTSTTKAVAVADLAASVSGIPTTPQASQSTHGTVRYATSTEVIVGTATDRVVTPADLKDRIDAIPAGDFVTTTDGIKHGINANLNSAPTLLDTGDDLNDIRHSGTWFVSGSCANKPPHASDGILTVDGHDGASAGGNSFWIQRYADFQGHQYSRYIYSIMLGSIAWRFDPWEEAFTGYRLVLVTVAPSVSTTVVITGDDFSSHTMFVCHTSAGSNLDFSLNTPSLATVRNGKSVHIRWASGPVAPTVLDTPAKLSPAGDYSLRTNGSTISLVRDTTVSSKVMVIGEMP